MVKPLVLRGYRLRTGHLSQNTRDEMESWNKYMELPFVRNKLRTFSGRDEIRDLNVLKCMAQPAYIVACYNFTCEDVDWDYKSRRYVRVGNVAAAYYSHLVS